MTSYYMRRLTKNVAILINNFCFTFALIFYSWILFDETPDIFSKEKINGGEKIAFTFDTWEKNSTMKVYKTIFYVVP